MNVEFIKDHPSGIKKGQSHDFPKSHAQKLVDAGFAKAKGVTKSPKVEAEVSVEEAEVIAEIEAEENELKKA